MSHFLMSLHKAPGLGKNPAGDLFLEQARPELGELLFRMTGPFGDGLADGVGEFAFVHVAAPSHPNDVRSLAKTHLAPAEPVGEEGHSGIAVDQRAIEVEEGADIRTFRTGLDCGDGVDCKHQCGSSAL